MAVFAVVRCSQPSLSESAFPSTDHHRLSNNLYLVRHRRQGGTSYRNREPIEDWGGFQTPLTWIRQSCHLGALAET